MSQDIEVYQERIRKLRARIKEGKHHDKQGVRDEIRALYIDMAGSIRALVKAQETLREIAQEFKQHQTTQNDVGRFYSFVKSTTSAELDLATLIDRAWNCIVMEDFDEAKKNLKHILDIDPDNIKGLCYMGLVLVELERYDEAMLFLQKVLVKDPCNPFALNNLGFICYKKGIWGEAIEHLVKAANQNKDRTATLYANYYLGLVYYERSMIPDAIKFFNRALQMGPNLQVAYYYLGLSEVKRYEFKDAVHYFKKTITIDKDSRYGRLAEEELKKIEPLAEPDKTMGKYASDDDQQPGGS
jgi:tetratricopeptide (TPR) repeat protein